MFLLKEQKGSESSGTTGERDVEKKAKPQKKSKISEEISVELVIKDLLDPTAEDIISSKKK